MHKLKAQNYPMQNLHEFRTEFLKANLQFIFVFTHGNDFLFGVYLYTIFSRNLDITEFI